MVGTSSFMGESQIQILHFIRPPYFYWSVLMYAAISFAYFDNQIIKLKKENFVADGWD